MRRFWYQKRHVCVWEKFAAQRQIMYVGSAPGRFLQTPSNYHSCGARETICAPMSGMDGNAARVKQMRRVFHYMECEFGGVWCGELVRVRLIRPHPHLVVARTPLCRVLYLSSRAFGLCIRNYNTTNICQLALQQ